MSTPSHLLRWSNRCYRLLLLAYPEDFRRRHGQEMYQTFRDCCRDELRAGGGNGLLRFWGLVLSDFLASVTIERITQLFTLFGLTKEQPMVNAFFSLQVAQNTDIGLKRQRNEDAVISVLPEDDTVRRQKGALFVVSDGLGGHNKGDVASKLAVDTIREQYYQNPEAEIEAALRAAFEVAHQRIRDDDEGQHHMGTTAVAAVVQDARVFIANVGDSLAYLIRGEQISQIAEDHSWIAQVMREKHVSREEAAQDISWAEEDIRAGKKTEEQARNANIITRCLGGEKPEIEVYTTSAPIQQGDILVLCTDGLHTLVSDEEIRQTAQSYPPEESSQRLIALANARGGPDNITALVMRVA